MEWLGLFCDVIPVVLHSRMDRVLALRRDCFGFESCDRNFLLFFIFNYNFYLKSLFCLPIFKMQGNFFYFSFYFTSI